MVHHLVVGMQRVTPNVLPVTFTFGVMVVILNFETKALVERVEAL